MGQSFYQIFFVVSFVTASQLSAKAVSIRWTGKEDPDASLSHLFEVLSAKSGFALASQNFMILEEKTLSTSHFMMLVPVVGNLPIKGQSIRIWKSKQTGRLIQIESVVDKLPEPPLVTAMWNAVKVTDDEALLISRKLVMAHPDDNAAMEMNILDQVSGKSVERQIVAKGRHGKHQIIIDMMSGKVLKYRYIRHPDAERFSLPAQVFPMWEQIEGSSRLTSREPRELKYLNPKVKVSTGNPFLALLGQSYLASKMDPFRGLTEQGRREGYWAMSWLRSQAKALVDHIPFSDNGFLKGVILDGQFATINLYPEALDTFKGIEFPARPSVQFRPRWQLTQAESWEIVPGHGMLGKPIRTVNDIWERLAQYLADHDPVRYINDGFDEVQVYFAINQLFDSLRPKGFDDPELSTRPFHAFLYDPDISYRDNAYYTDDTINFTTYSPGSQNMARDNPTIWHELGHGVMDRLMGDYLTLADTGGLSEGMADFVADLVVYDVTDGQFFEGRDKFRIINQTGFFLTNEVHDDGEAYGGVMHDILDRAFMAEGQLGLKKMTDLTMEAMRLTRNHPGLTANDWFDHLIFADELGRAGLRNPGEMRGLILTSLAGRNFSAMGAPVAQFSIQYQGNEISSEAEGAREQPIKIERVPAGETFPLRLALVETETYKFKYPVKVEVGLRGGPIQGAIQWKGEDVLPVVYEFQTKDQVLPVDLGITGKCDEINRTDNSCVDFAYIKVFNAGQTQPVAKKRFYLRLYP